jgi:hypothetical protein
MLFYIKMPQVQGFHKIKKAPRLDGLKFYLTVFLKRALTFLRFSF